MKPFVQLTYANFEKHAPHLLVILKHHYHLDYYRDSGSSISGGWSLCCLNHHLTSRTQPQPRDFPAQSCAPTFLLQNVGLVAFSSQEYIAELFLWAVRQLGFQQTPSAVGTALSVKTFGEESLVSETWERKAVLPGATL